MAIVYMEQKLKHLRFVPRDLTVIKELIPQLNVRLVHTWMRKVPMSQPNVNSVWQVRSAHIVV
jgi:hypothetical protein